MNGPGPPAPASDGTTGVYGITVAAELAGMSVQALRLYERKGLLHPDRTSGGTRRYSDTDIVRLRRIGQLINDGINLTGIGRILGLEADNAAIRSRNQHLHTDNRHLRAHNNQLSADNTDLRADNTDLRAANSTLQAANDALTNPSGALPSP
jgi:MerR family transcriptional regulator/heat shock protein HspR